jgi:hypothetical protein
MAKNVPDQLLRLLRQSSNTAHEKFNWCLVAPMISQPPVIQGVVALTGVEI